jgi:hypothetical protein
MRTYFKMFVFKQHVSINTGGKQQYCKLCWEISWMFRLHWWPCLLCRVTFVDSRYAYIKLWFWCYFGFVFSLKWSSLSRGKRYNIHDVISHRVKNFIDKINVYYIICLSWSYDKSNEEFKKNNPLNVVFLFSNRG